MESVKVSKQSWPNLTEQINEMIQAIFYCCFLFRLELPS